MTWRSRKLSSHLEETNVARRPAVAGMFYESEQDALLRGIQQCFLSKLGPGRLPHARSERLGRVIGLVSPHAGYVYSGPAAAWAYASLASDGIPDVAVILGPNHQGYGANVAVSVEPEWLTPLGTAQADIEVAEEIVGRSRYAEVDDRAHTHEHSVEVQIPFLQFLAGDKTRIVAICLAHLPKPDALALVADLGAAIAGSLEGRNAVVIASTDFTHYESRASAQIKDESALGRILLLDGPGLIDVVYEQSITMCGAIGTAVMLEACKRMGAETVRQLAYYTSGDVTGDISQVVGYASVSVEL